MLSRDHDDQPSDRSSSGTYVETDSLPSKHIEATTRAASSRTWTSLYPFFGRYAMNPASRRLRPTGSPSCRTRTVAVDPQVPHCAPLDLQTSRP